MTFFNWLEIFRRLMNKAVTGNEEGGEGGTVEINPEPEPSGPSYWNGSDSTLDQLLNTQWGMGSDAPPTGLSGSLLTSEPNAGAIESIDGGGWYEVVVQFNNGTTLPMTYPVYFSLSIDTTPSWAIQINKGGGSVSPTLVGVDPDGWKLYEIAAGAPLTQFGFFDYDYGPVPFARIWDGDPR